ncbi:MAG: hypothetical protein L6Q81_08330 [Bacteroidia bacterium]|nr:hypothetical protein [Bacteroidia bacterium]
MNKVISPRLVFVISAVAIAALTRILPHPPNFTAVGAMALLAGALVPNRLLSLVMPMAALFITDLVLGFHNTMWAVYAAVGFTSMIGWMISKRQNILTITAGSLISIASFFFITNAAMWVVGFFTQGFYPTTAAGLGLALESGLPFLTNDIISNLLFTAIFFGSFHALRIWKPAFVKA